MRVTGYTANFRGEKNAFRYSKVFVLALVAGLALLLGPVPSAGAQATAALNGIVKDSSGALIQNAQVKLTNVDTRVVQTTLTNSTGVYHFLNIEPGHYTVQASMSGFETAVHPEFALEVNETSNVNFTMQVGSSTVEVNVQGQGVELETSTAELGTVIGTEEVRSLPLNGRNFTELLLLTPGTSSANPLQNGSGPPEAIGSVVMPALNGQSNRSNMFWLDGVSNYGGGGMFMHFNPPSTISSNSRFSPTMTMRSTDR